MKRVALLLLLLLLAAAAGCGNDRSTYPSILIWQGQTYIGKGAAPQDEYGEAQPVGTVSARVAADQTPTEELSSNGLDAGTEIYLLDENRLLA